MPRNAEISEYRQSTSSLFARLNPELRHQVDRAIVRRQPATLRAVFESFRLAERGVSRSAFYRYAARLRRHAVLFDYADLAGLHGPAANDAIMTVLATRLLDAAVDDDVPIEVLAQIAQTQKLTAAASLAIARMHARSDASATSLPPRPDEDANARRSPMTTSAQDPPSVTPH